MADDSDVIFVDIQPRASMIAQPSGPQASSGIISAAPARKSAMHPDLNSGSRLPMKSVVRSAAS
jgi:hypothetical protein